MLLPHCKTSVMSLSQKKIDYTIPVTDSQQLEVTVLADPDNHSRRILRWKEAATSDWEEQTTLPVIGSDQ